MKSSIIKRIFSISPERQAADKLYTRIVEQSRDPVFYTRANVQDTVDGRFDLLVLNAILVLRRLKGQNAYAAKVSQALFDTMFDNMDEGLREIGVGDLSVGSKIKSMAEAFYGRVAAYEDGIQGHDDQGLREAIARNLYRDAEITHETLSMMSDYVRRQVTSLEKQNLDDLLAGQIDFEPLHQNEVSHES